MSSKNTKQPKKNNALRSLTIQFKQLLGQHEPNIFQYMLDEEEKESLLSNPTSTTKCGICFDDYNYDDAVCIPDCFHHFCILCIDSYLRHQIMNSQVYQIKCPQNTCTNTLNDEFTELIVEQEFMQKMLKFRRIKILSEDNDVRWCSRPGCENILRRKAKEVLLECQCGEWVCFKCGNSAHDMNCEKQIDKTLKEALQKFKIQQCPQCSTPIQKLDGCNNITCQRCGYEFCWLCRSKQSPSHFQPYNFLGCPGQQYNHRDPKRHPYLMRTLLIILFIVIGIPLLLILVVLFGVMGIFCSPSILYFVRGGLRKKRKCQERIIIWIGLALGGLISSPFVLISAAILIALSPLIAIYYLLRK